MFGDKFTQTKGSRQVWDVFFFVFFVRIFLAILPETSREFPPLKINCLFSQFKPWFCVLMERFFSVFQDSKLIQVLKVHYFSLAVAWSDLEPRVFALNLQVSKGEVGANLDVEAIKLWKWFNVPGRNPVYVSIYKASSTFEGWIYSPDFLREFSWE